MKKLLFLLLGLAAGNVASAQLGIDSSFGVNGYLPCTISLGLISTNLGSAQSIAIQPDGKIVTAVDLNDPNTTHLYYTTNRYNADGTPDSSFGGGGVSEVFVGDESNNADVQVQPDGRIISIGHAEYCIGGICGAQNFVLLRMKPDGTPDSSFGTNGIVQSGSVFGPGVYSLPNRVILKANGEYLVGGRGVNGLGFVAILDSIGNLNTDFGNNGLFTDSLSAPLVDMDVDAAGNIYGLMETYVPGSGNTYNANCQVVKLLPGGSIDHSFGVNGFATFDFSPYDQPEKIRVRPDGRIVFAGETAPSTSFEAYGDSTEGFVMILEPNGTPMAGVPANGYSYLIPGDSSLFIHALTILPDNRMLTGGFAQHMTDNFFQKGFVQRLNADGSPDASFSNGASYITFDYGLSSNIGSLCGVNAIQRLSNGDLLAAGYRNPKQGSVLTSVMVTKLKDANNPTGLAGAQADAEASLYPNPWHGALRLDYTLPQPGRITVALYDAAGRQAAVLLSGAARGKGAQQETFVRPQQLSPGYYQLVLSTGAGAHYARSVVVE